MGSKKKNNEMKGRAKDGGAADGGPDGGKHRHGNKVITDPRFASVHSDPRFREAPKHKAKVSIDSRFNRMFTDKNFDSSKARIDKRGRVKKDSSQHPLKHYYHLEEEEEEEEEVEEKKKKKKKKRGSRGKSEKEVESDRDISEEDESDSDNDSDDDNLKKLANSRDKSESLGSRGEEEEEEEEEDDDEEEEEDEDNDDEIDSEKSSASTTDSDDDDDLYLEGEDTFVQEENVPEIDKETHRLAVVNLDWGQVKAVDLFVLLSSFLPKGGQILSLSVYPSEFGLKRMEEEAVHGPVGLFDDKKEKNEDEDDDEIDNEKLRAYELSRLRYYYAVVECDSIATADYLYKTCDGVEFERSSNKLDLRFIPDSMEFKHPPRDVAKEAPGNYEGLDFQTRALQQSSIELTWDEDEPQRAKTLKRKFNADQLADLELKEFLASDEGETEEEDTDNSTEHKSSKKHKKEDMYRALLASGDASDGDEEMDDQDMEVTFNTGLEDISKRILEKNDKKSETVWEAYLRKRRDKKKGMKKNRSKNSSDDEFSDTDQEPKEDADDFFVESTSVKGNKDGGSKKGKRNQQSAEDDEASRAELELLLADDEAKDSKLKGYNLKRKKGKDKKGKAITDEGKIPDVDLEDPRFSAMFTSPLFALDPTDPQFKRSAAYARQVAQKQQKVEGENTDRKEHTEICWQGRLGDENVAEEKDEQRKSSELSSLVRSIKMKTNKASMPSGKSRGKPKARK